MLCCSKRDKQIVRAYITYYWFVIRCILRHWEQLHHTSIKTAPSSRSAQQRKVALFLHDEVLLHCSNRDICPQPLWAGTSSSTLDTDNPCAELPAHMRHFLNCFHMILLIHVCLLSVFNWLSVSGVG